MVLEALQREQSAAAVDELRVDDVTGVKDMHRVSLRDRFRHRVSRGNAGVLLRRLELVKKAVHGVKIGVDQHDGFTPIVKI